MPVAYKRSLASLVAHWRHFCDIIPSNVPNDQRRLASRSPPVARPKTTDRCQLSWVQLVSDFLPSYMYVQQLLFHTPRELPKTTNDQKYATSIRVTCPKGREPWIKVSINSLLLNKINAVDWKLQVWKVFVLWSNLNFSTSWILYVRGFTCIIYMIYSWNVVLI